MKKALNSKVWTYTIVILIVLSFFLVRLFSERHLDDISPAIPCDKSLLEKADVLYVIPKFDNVNISDNVEWCKEILSYNKSIAMHGVYHTYNEFLIERNESYLMGGAEAFKKCFGYYPLRFKPPQVAISSSNSKLIKTSYKLDTWFSERFHKVYHCNEEGMFPNWVSDII